MGSEVIGHCLGFGSRNEWHQLLFFLGPQSYSLFIDISVVSYYSDVLMSQKLNICSYAYSPSLL